MADDKAPARLFWTISQANPLDERGNLVRSTLGNGLRTDHVLDSISGKPFRLRAGPSGAANNVFDHSYQYDAVGNVVERNAGFGSGVETFRHDLLDRLTHYTVQDSPALQANRTVQLSYNALGNILHKSDVGDYVYAGPSPHAVSWAAGTTYTYDAAGNLLSSQGPQPRTQTWTDFNLPQRLEQSGRSVSFAYDERHQRVKETITTPEGQRQLFILHPDNAGGLAFEREETYANGALVRNESRHYISVMGSVVAVVKVLNHNQPGHLHRDAGVPDDAQLTLYWHRDALGSVVAVSNGVGRVLERPAFDPWGRRLGNDRLPDTSATGPAHGDRGFTGHEHLDEIGLVHMNGRVYDPILGRFLSPDPYIQAPEELQNYNAYSYVLNRPLLLTDPSGEFVWQIPVFIIGFTLTQEGNKHWRMVGQIMMMVALGGQHGALQSAGMANAYAANAFAAFAATVVMPNSTPQDALKSALFAAAFTHVGLSSLSDPAAVAAHMMLGCLQGATSGGECGPSAMAAGFSKLVTINTPPGLDPVVKGLIATLAGGTASVIGGGGSSPMGLCRRGLGTSLMRWRVPPRAREWQLVFRMEQRPFHSPLIVLEIRGRTPMTLG